MNACSLRTKNNAQTHPILPSACLEKTGTFTPVKNIKTKTSFLEKEKRYSPIKANNGTIKSDFNNDNTPDYFFIENNLTNIQSKPQLVLCISSGRHYQRKLPPFPIHVNTKPDFQSIHERIEWKNNQLILSVFKYEHNWGSDDELNSYHYSNKNQDFILDKRELVSSSGDGMRSNTHTIYNLKSLRYQKKSQCGSQEEACHPYQLKGHITFPKVKPSLFNPRTITQN